VEQTAWQPRFGPDIRRVTRIGVVLLLALLLPAPTIAQPDILLGTWTRRPSPVVAAHVEFYRIVYEDRSNGSVQISWTGVDPDGRPAAAKCTVRFDGRDYAYFSSTTGAIETLSVEAVSASRFRFARKFDGRIVDQWDVVVAPDRRTYAVFGQAERGSGEPDTYAAVYERD
jgi:hypothetical protein